jgi:hypothetical protein
VVFFKCIDPWMNFITKSFRVQIARIWIWKPYDAFPSVDEEEGTWQTRLTTVDGASLELDPDLLQFNEGDDPLLLPSQSVRLE